VAAQLDMAVIGDVCVGVTLAGYQSVLTGFLNDESGSSAHLLTALERGDAASLRPLAHAVKGAAASLGLRAVQALALQIETEGASYDPDTCTSAAAQLRDLLDTARALLQRMGFFRPSA
jgi:HPt (histidine-containing phosphotransfer) domain-containing protein